MHEVDVKKKEKNNICKHDQTHLKCTVPVQVSLASQKKERIITRPTFLIFTVHIYGNIKTVNESLVL